LQGTFFTKAGGQIKSRSTMKLREIYRSDTYYSVCECDRVPGLVIDVTCGGMVMYRRIVELTPEEVDAFRKRGHLDDIAYRIGKGDKSLLARELKPTAENEQIQMVEKL